MRAYLPYILGFVLILSATALRYVSKISEELWATIVIGVAIALGAYKLARSRLGTR